MYFINIRERKCPKQLKTTEQIKELILNLKQKHLKEILQLLTKR